jgi:uncharacterized cupredoxin-like copper-binding protein
VVARRWAVVSVAVAGLTIAGCSSSSKSGSPSTTPSGSAGSTRPAITIVAHDFNFEVPATVPSGYVDVTLKNEGQSEHQAQIVRLGSMSLADFEHVSEQTDIVAVKRDTVFVGGPNDSVPGRSTTATLKLEPGKYAVLCYIPGTDGKPHVAKGMLAVFQAEPTDASVNTAPTAASTIALRDFTYTVPPHFSGKGLVDIANEGTEVHELNMFKMAPGVTLGQAEQALLAPKLDTSKVTAVTGVVGLSPHQHAWLDLDLTPGKYLMFCVFPDPKKNNTPHFAEGMYKVFTIT